METDTGVQQKVKRYALGCAFSLRNILERFPYKRLRINCKDSINLVNDPHRNFIVSKVFKFHLRQVLYDIVNNNVTFWLPTTGSIKCNIHMRRFTGNAFKNLRRAGKWLDVDFLLSDFTGYLLSFYMFGKRTPRVKSVYVSKEFRDIITTNTNNGMPYGDGKIDTTIKNYLEEIYKEFPQIPKSDIKLILTFIWKSIYLLNSYGGDFLLQDPMVWFYIGNLKKAALDHFHYYIRKLSIKLQVLYKRKKYPWDGYYYFALTNKQYEKYLALKKSRGRPRKYFKFEKLMMYEILDECRISEFEKRYIFRIPYISRVKLKFFVPELTTDSAELIITREPMKFKDILVCENKYDLLC